MIARTAPTRSFAWFSSATIVIPAYCEPDAHLRYARLDLWLQLQHEAAELRGAADAGAREIAALQRERELLQVSLRCAPLRCRRLRRLLPRPAPIPGPSDGYCMFREQRVHHLGAAACAEGAPGRGGSRSRASGKL